MAIFHSHKLRFRPKTTTILITVCRRILTSACDANYKVMLSNLHLICVCVMVVLNVVIPRLYRPGTTNIDIKQNIITYSPKHSLTHVCIDPSTVKSEPECQHIDILQYRREPIHNHPVHALVTK